MTDDLVKELRKYRVGCGIHCSHYDSGERLEECLEAADRIEALEKALRFAAGMISTMPPFDIDHPEEALKWIMEESAALGEKKDD